MGYGTRMCVFRGINHSVMVEVVVSMVHECLWVNNLKDHTGYMHQRVFKVNSRWAR